MNIILGDLTAMRFECLVNAANGCPGIMGRGIAGALKRAGGDIVQASAQAACRGHSFTRGGRGLLMGFDAGETYTSDPGRLSANGVKAIVHAVTMYTPASPTSVSICRTALDAAVHSAVIQGFKSIGIPALGTGVGNLDKKQVAAMMIDLLRHYDDLIEINIVDIDSEFIDHCRLELGK